MRRAGIRQGQGDFSRGMSGGRHGRDGEGRVVRRETHEFSLSSRHFKTLQSGRLVYLVSDHVAPGLSLGKDLTAR